MTRVPNQESLSCNILAAVLTVISLTALLIIFYVTCRLNPIRANPRAFWFTRSTSITRYTANYDEALEDLDRAIELMPDVAGVIELHAQVYWELKRYKATLEGFTRAIELRPNDSWDIGLRGQVHWDMNNLDKALEDFDKAIALDENLIISLCN